MEFLLLVLAITSLMLRAHLLHAGLLAAHILIGLWLAKIMLKRQPVSSYFLVIYIAMYMLNPFLIAVGIVPLEAQSSSDDFYNGNVMLMVGFDLFVIAARRLRVTRKDISVMPRLFLRSFPVDLCTMLALGMCAAVLALLIAVVGTMGLNPFTVEKTFRVGAWGDTEATRTYLLATYVLTLLPLAVFLIGLRRFHVQVLYLVPACALLLMHLGIFRIRAVAVSCFVAYLTAAIVRDYLVTVGETKLKSRIPAIRQFLIIVGLPMLALLAISIKFWRGAHARGDFRVTEERVDLEIQEAFAGGDLGHSYFLRRSFGLFPERHPYLNGQSYYRLLYVWIPRFVWPEKPYHTSRIFAAVIEPELARKSGLSIAPGLVADLYINFGYAGVFGMLVFGLAFGNERYRGLTDLFFLAGAGHWMFYLVRGSTSSPILVMIVMWVFAAILTRIIKPVKVPPAIAGGPGLLPPAAPIPIDAPAARLGTDHVSP